MDKSNWMCPVCTSTDYWTLRGENFEKPGDIHYSNGLEPISGYECKGCSARFEDPEKFCRNNIDAISASTNAATAS